MGFAQPFDRLVPEKDSSSIDRFVPTEFPELVFRIPNNQKENQKGS